jgi:hypothetical protein
VHWHQARRSRGSGNHRDTVARGLVVDHRIRGVLTPGAAQGYIIYGQWLSVALTTILGAVLARRFAKIRSLAVVWLEHALYGLMAFTLGLGSYFYNGVGD